MKDKEALKILVGTKGACHCKQRGLDLPSGRELTIHHRYNGTHSHARHGGETESVENFHRRGRHMCVWGREGTV